MFPAAGILLEEKPSGPVSSQQEINFFGRCSVIPFVEYREYTIIAVNIGGREWL